MATAVVGMACIVAGGAGERNMWRALASHSAASLHGQRDACLQPVQPYMPAAYLPAVLPTYPQTIAQLLPLFPFKGAHELFHNPTHKHAASACVPVHMPDTWMVSVCTHACMHVFVPTHLPTYRQTAPCTSPTTPSQRTGKPLLLPHKALHHCNIQVQLMCGF
jgi:hypothetical protein